ncbi:MAG: GIY-YIG nuclease family protein [Pseudomonadota bacterium]
MSRERRRELTAAYKEVKARPGVYAVRCAATGEAWVFAARNLENREPGVWFSLRLGSHKHEAMQAAWKAQGGEGFTYEELASVDPDGLAAWQLAERLKALEAHWREALGAAMSGG